MANTAREVTKVDYERRLEDAYRERIKIEEQLAAATRQWEVERAHLPESRDSPSFSSP